MTELDDKKKSRVLHLFRDKCGDRKPKDYRSFSGMRQANGKRTIKLMFGYNESKNPIYSEAVSFNSLGMFIEAQRVLDLHLDRDEIEDDLFDGLDEEGELGGQAWEN